MDASLPEINRPEPRLYRVNQEFSLFPPGESAKFQLDLEGVYTLNFEPRVEEYDCSKFDTLTPFTPELGYQISPEDLNPQQRLEKFRNILHGKSIYDDLMLHGIGMLSVGNPQNSSRLMDDPLFNKDFFDRLGLFLIANGQKYIGFPLIDGPAFTDSRSKAVSTVAYNTFTSAEFDRIIPLSEEIKALEDIEGETIKSGVGELWEAGFKLGLPRKPENLQTIKAKFIMLPYAPKLNG